MANPNGITTRDPQEVAYFQQLCKEHLKPDGTPNITQIAAIMGRSRLTLKAWPREANQTIEYPPFVMDGDPEEPIEELLARRKTAFERKLKASTDRKWFQVKVREQKPYGVLMFGDPHLDDDGCNYTLLDRHLSVARQDGIYGINIGDTTNNWTGRLMRLYAKQEASESQAKRLAEWFMFDAGVKWLCWILGNHDDWNGGADFHKRLGGGHIPIIDWRAQFEIAHPSGSTARIDASHGRKGSSIWNNLHATLRAAKLGELADLYVTGHTHSFGLEDLEIPERAMSCWLVQLRGFKFMDTYALHNNFAEHQRGASVLAIIDPSKDARRTVMCFEDVEEGAEYLAWKRR